MRRIIPILIVFAISFGFRALMHKQDKPSLRNSDQEIAQAIAEDDARNGKRPLVKRGGGQPDIVGVKETDTKMNDAMNTARQTVGEITTAMRNPKPNQRFTVKMKVTDGHATEYMWLNNLTFDGKLFHGTLSDAPYEVKNYTMGQAVTVAPNEIADWIIRDGATEHGGYTEKVLREKGM